MAGLLFTNSHATTGSVSHQFQSLSFPPLPMVPLHRTTPDSSPLSTHHDKFLPGWHLCYPTHHDQSVVSSPSSSHRPLTLSNSDLPVRISKINFQLSIPPLLFKTSSWHATSAIPSITLAVTLRGSDQLSACYCGFLSKYSGHQALTYDFTIIPKINS